MIQQMGMILKTSKLNNGILAHHFELSKIHTVYTGCTKEKIVLGSQKKRTLQAWLSQYLWYHLIGDIRMLE